MSNKHLNEYIAQRNSMARFFPNEKVYDINDLSFGDKVDLLEAIDCDLSPENLCCDGELRGAALKKKHARLLGAQAALEKIL